MSFTSPTLLAQLALRSTESTNEAQQRTLNGSVLLCDGQQQQQQPMKQQRSPAAPADIQPEMLKNALLKDGDIVFDPATPFSPNTRDRDFPLYDYENVPRWLEGNPFVTSYYRCGYSTMKCFKSVFAWHNETVNIWSHMIGFLIALALTIHVTLHMGLGRKRDYLVFSLLEMGSLAMLGGSSVYHTLTAHYSSRVHDCALALDYTGISAMTLGSFYTPVFYLFSCSKDTRFAYFAVVTTLGLISLMGPAVSASFSTEKFYHVRMTLFCGIAIIGGLMPGFHMFLTLPSNEVTTPIYQGMLLFLAIYLAGLLLYIFKIPECFFPGHFDLLLSSHQIWHYFVLAAAVIQYFTAIAAFQIWRVTGVAGGECI